MQLLVEGMVKVVRIGILPFQFIVFLSLFEDLDLPAEHLFFLFSFYGIVH